MNFFKKKYQYILPIVCVASLSAQATDLTEQEISAITGQATELTQQEIADLLTLQNDQEKLDKYRKLIEDRKLINNQREEFRNTLYNDMVLKDPALVDLNKKLNSLQASVEAHQERFNKFPENANLLKNLENCEDSLQKVQAQVNLLTASLMKEYKKECEDRGINLTAPSSSQPVQNIPHEIKVYEEHRASHEVSSLPELEDYDLLGHSAETWQHISSYLSAEEKGVFRQTSRSIKKKVIDEGYKLNLKKNFINNASAAMGDVLTETPETTLEIFKNHYTYKLMQEACAEYIEMNKFLAVSQGSFLEVYLNQDYASVPLYNYLKDQPDSTRELFKILFGKTIPEGKYELALNLLCGCLPSNHIYVKNGIEDASPLLEKFNIALLKSMKSSKRKYFLWGIDEDLNILKDQEHIIVINQSNQENLHKLEDFPYSTVIYNADQEVLNSPLSPLEGMQEIILVNGNNQCLSIGNEFLYMHLLRSSIIKGLSSVKKIGNKFLANCGYLSNFDARGLSAVQEIQVAFLNFCDELITVDTMGLNNVQKIEGAFLYACNKLSNFNPRGLGRVKEIRDNFLSLSSIPYLDCRYLSDLQKIGSHFLLSCKKLTDFDTRGLRNVTEIGSNFLASTPLSSFNSKGFEKVQKIGQKFLHFTYICDEEREKIKATILKKQ